MTPGGRPRVRMPAQLFLHQLQLADGELRLPRGDRGTARRGRGGPGLGRGRHREDLRRPRQAAVRGSCSPTRHKDHTNGVGELLRPARSPRLRAAAPRSTSPIQASPGLATRCARSAPVTRCRSAAWWRPGHPHARPHPGLAVPRTPADALSPGDTRLRRTVAARPARWRPRSDVFRRLHQTLRQAARHDPALPRARLRGRPGVLARPRGRPGTPTSSSRIAASFVAHRMRPRT